MCTSEDPFAPAVNTSAGVGVLGPDGLWSGLVVPSRVAAHDACAPLWRMLCIVGTRFAPCSFPVCRTRGALRYSGRWSAARWFAMVSKPSRRLGLAYALRRCCCGLIEFGARAATRQHIVHEHICTPTCVFNLYTKVVQFRTYKDHPNLDQ